MSTSAEVLPVITIFATPKPFISEAITIMQRNAIRSWVELGPECEIILLGSDQGVPEIARELGIMHVPDLETNQFDTPLISSIFDQGIRHSRTELMAYVNSDIILMQDFLSAAVRTPTSTDALLVGRRWDLNIIEEIDFSNPNWSRDLIHRVRASGAQDPAFGGSDYFVFRRNFWGAIPEITIGRYIFDNWLMNRALEVGAMLIDTSSEIVAVHPLHDYSHHPDGTEGVRYGPETWSDLNLAGGPSIITTLFDADYKMTEDAIVSRENDIYERQMIAQMKIEDQRWLAELYRRHRQDTE